MSEYNEENQRIDMVLFNMALEHLTRIYRVLRMDTGHIMLIGVGGSGKALMTKLAAFTASTNECFRKTMLCVSWKTFRVVRLFPGCEIFSIILSRGYNEMSFKDDLKKLFTMVGVENKSTVFFLTQSQISEESTKILWNRCLKQYFKIFWMLKVFWKLLITY